jgi:dTDP-4-dehydrorhamnose 3,5-epimerase
MQVTEFRIQGPKLIEPKMFGDERGFFSERYRRDIFSDLGIANVLIQDNFSRSAAKVLRGLHFQFNRPQGKLVTALTGSLLDVIVDIRRDSLTFGETMAVELSGDKPRWFWVPPGFAHSFLVLSPEGADVLYKVDAYYNASGEGGLKWNDPDLSIDWPTKNPLISARDQVLPSWQEYLKNPRF